MNSFSAIFSPIAVAMLLCSGLGCSKLNPSFGDAADSGTGGTTDGTTDGTTSRPPEPTGNSAGSSQPPNTSPPVSTSSTTSGATSDDSTGGTAGEDPQTSGQGSESETEDDPVACEPSLIPCNVYAGSTDCPGVLICRPQGNMDGYQETVCVESTSPDNQDPDGACTIECGQFGGIDDCRGHRLCDPFQDDATQRRCTEICQGTPLLPICPEEQSCLVAGDDASAVFGLCRHQCNPLNTATCNSMVCAALEPSTSPDFVCVPPAPTAGGDGDECEVPGDCAEGLLCASCTASEPCCSTVCDTGAENPNEVCGLGLECSPYAEEGGHPLTPAAVGVCV